MDFIVENWYILVGLLAIIAAVVVYIVRFFKKPTEKQLESIKEWLLWATTEAEKRFGSGTGKLKLRYVYDLFAETFPWLAKIVSFETFSKLVDSALGDMNNLLASNNAVQLYVNGSAAEETEADG
jgi:hypothetical protein